MAEVICTGVAFLNLVFEVDRLPAGAGEGFARDYARVGGGMAATAAVAVARLGGFASFWGCLGDDETGDLIVADIARFGVDVDRVRRLPGARSPMSSISIDARGARQVVAFPGSGLGRDAAWLPGARIEDTNAVLADPRWPEGARAALRIARQHSVPGILDGEAGTAPPPDDLIGLASHVVFSRTGLAQYAGTDDIPAGLEKAAAAANGLVATTAGADGFYWLDPARGGLRHVPAVKVDAVDTLGAGDVFRGAFALAIGEDKSIETAARFASIAAGLTCTRFGVRDAIPDRATVWRLMEAQTAA